uniref:(northern house mosquito) hypothetical protein n=1 Tax=Culex pipiens TaxID=7175 RepID=A0A8D8BEP6_CULPI
MTPSCEASDNLILTSPTTASNNLIEILTYCQNFNRMKSAAKIDTINQAISGCLYTAILGTETSWDASILSEEVFSSNFNVFRNDRNLLSSGKKSGGGVLVAIKADFDSEKLDSDVFAHFEHVWVKAQIAKETHIFASVYFPPLSPLSSYEDFFRNAEKIISSLDPESKIHLFGR